MSVCLCMCAGFTGHSLLVIAISTKFTCVGTNIVSTFAREQLVAV